MLKTMAIVVTGVLAAVSPLALSERAPQRGTTTQEIGPVAYARPTRGLVALATTAVEPAAPNCRNAVLADLAGALTLTGAPEERADQPPNRRCRAA